MERVKNTALNSVIIYLVFSLILGISLRYIFLRFSFFPTVSMPVLLATYLLMVFLGAIGVYYSVAYMETKELAEKEGPDYVFVKVGPNKWLIRFEDERLFLDDLKGVRYIARLLGNTSKEIPAIKLSITKNVISAKLARLGFSRANKIDKRYLKETETSLRHLRIELEQARKENDLAKERKTQDEIDRITKIISDGKGLGGEIQHFKDSEEKSRVAVKQAIGRTLKSIEEQCPKLYKHLSNSLYTGRECSYQPDRDIHWHL